MDYKINFKRGSAELSAEEYIRISEETDTPIEYKTLDEPENLNKDNILAVHYADSGAQGEGGAVEILYYKKENSVEVLKGNYAYGDLDLDAIILKLPMLKQLDTRYRMDPPYPFGGTLHIPEGWGYLYMGAMNHFFVRSEISGTLERFIKLLCGKGYEWDIFSGAAWFCGARKTE